MRRTETRDIDGRQFSLTQLPAMRGVKLFYKLVAAIGPALAVAGKGIDMPMGNILKGGAKALMASNVNLGQVFGNLGEAAQVLFEKLPEDQFMAILRELLETASFQKDGATIALLPVIDMEMAGEVFTILKLVQFALELNFRDFRLGPTGSAAAQPVTVQS